MPCGFFLSSVSLPRLISAVGDWMSTILPHMVWPWCEFRMQVWNVLHAARWKYRMQKIAIWAISSQLRHVSTIGKKLVKQQYLLHMSPQYDELRPINGWERFASLWHTKQISTGFGPWLCYLLHRRHKTKVNQTLRDVWPSAGLLHYIYIFGVLAPKLNFTTCKIHLCSTIFAALLHGTRVVGAGHWPTFLVFIVLRHLCFILGVYLNV